ncbi:ROK family protein [Terriglobus tenax]|uniref:ROK family protein n=1 Tax=Terriglobus tenax TaxID=1111115 RepID=UPI0021E0465F|nr:ROK family protein [Terriglobus tenax]
MHKVLAIDVGGTHIKVLATGKKTPIKIASGPDATASYMVEQVLAATASWEYDRISIGYPGPVIRNKPADEPHNLGPGWVDFDYEKAFGKPVRILNDAAMQALGSYEGGRMLFLGLGTGLGTAMILDGTIASMELAHLPYRKGKTYEEFVGKDGLKLRGRKKWQRSVHDIIERLRAALLCEYVVLGGGNAKLLEELPEGVLMGTNANAFAGGFRLWDETPITGNPKNVIEIGRAHIRQSAARRHQHAHPRNT